MIAHSQPYLSYDYNTKKISCSFYHSKDYFSEDAINEANRKIKEIKNKKYVTTLEKDDVVFFDKSSKIPRYKFNSYCEGKELKRTIKEDKATIVVINEDELTLLEESLKKPYYNTFTPILFKDLKLQFELNNVKISNNGNLKDDEYIALDPKGMQYYDYNVRNYATLKITSTEPSRKFSYFYSSSGLISKLENLNSSYEGKKLIQDKDLNKIISEDGVVIDTETFDEITKMLTSNSNDNLSLAFEILANSNYRENLFPIGIILNTHKEKFQNVLRKGGVNLKNFAEFFSKEVKWEQSQDKFLYNLRKSLLNKGELKEDQDHYIRITMLGIINSYLNNYNCTVDNFNWKN